ncbi:HSP20-like chaperone [Mycena galopus ATCC 62051]|nr:HSP20-like chaperone [Mycena galopus ATCC 62051]
MYYPSYDVERITTPLVVWAASTTTARLFSARTGTTMFNALSGQVRRMDLHEDSKANTKEDVQIDVNNGRLSISAESKISENYERDGYAIRERRFGKIARTLQLPQGVKETEVKAAIENGLLTVTFPKSTPEQAPKKITIS